MENTTPLPNSVLTFNEREQIEKLIKNDLSLTKIAEQINRSKNCVVAEVRVNGGRKHYSARKAEQRAEQLRLRKNFSLCKGTTEKIETEALNKLKEIYNAGGSLIEMRKQTGFGVEKCNQLIINYIAELHIKKFIELERRIAALEGEKSEDFEMGLSRDELYSKYITKEETT